MHVVPRYVICVLGRWDDFSEVRAAVAACGDDFTFDEQYSQLAADARMPTAFEASQDRFDPSITEEDWSNIEAHTAVAYILSPPLPPEAAERISARTLLLAAKLLEEGASAVKSESAGLAHGRGRGVELGRVSGAGERGGGRARASAPV